LYCRLPQMNDRDDDDFSIALTPLGY
jgi:hypothetical protein